MSDSESTDDPYDHPTPHDRNVTFDHQPKHAVLAMRDGDDIAVWVEYDGKSLARANGRAPDDGDSGLSITTPTAGGETLHDLPDGYAAVLWANNGDAEEGFYCFGCETVYESSREGNTHHNPHTCEPFTPSIGVAARSEVPTDE